MRKFFTALIVIPLGLLFVVFAVANRHFVTVSFDPFNARDPSVGIAMPLFVVIILVAILGVLAGGIATWIRQGFWRRAARQYETEARQARAELADLRAGTMPHATHDSGYLALPPQGVGYDPARRDKHGATL
jgi:uncharacterized integral membrane protein